MEALSSIMLVLGILLVLLLILGGWIFAAVADYHDLKNMNQPNPKATVIKTVYFYLVSLISLFIIVFGAIDLINIGLRTWVFPKADKNPYSYPCASGIYPTAEKTPNADLQRQSCLEDQKRQDETQAVQKQRDAVRDISLIVVGVPLFALHWLAIRRENKRRETSV